MTKSLLSTYASYDPARRYWVLRDSLEELERAAPGPGFIRVGPMTNASIDAIERMISGWERTGSTVDFRAHGHCHRTGEPWFEIEEYVLTP